MCRQRYSLFQLLDDWRNAHARKLDHEHDVDAHGQQDRGYGIIYADVAGDDGGHDVALDHAHAAAVSPSRLSSWSRGSWASNVDPWSRLFSRLDSVRNRSLPGWCHHHPRCDVLRRLQPRIALRRRTGTVHRRNLSTYTVEIRLPKALPRSANAYSPTSAPRPFRRTSHRCSPWSAVRRLLLGTDADPTCAGSDEPDRDGCCGGRDRTGKVASRRRMVSKSDWPGGNSSGRNHRRHFRPRILTSDPVSVPGARDLPDDQRPIGCYHEQRLEDTMPDVPKWSVKGDWFDACKCAIPCPCYFAQPPTYGDCDGVLAWHIREGNYGGVPLAGLNVVGLGSFTGNIWAGA